MTGHFRFYFRFWPYFRFNFSFSFACISVSISVLKPFCTRSRYTHNLLMAQMSYFYMLLRLCFCHLLYWFEFFNFICVVGLCYFELGSGFCGWVLSHTIGLERRICSMHASPVQLYSSKVRISGSSVNHFIQSLGLCSVDRLHCLFTVCSRRYIGTVT